MQVLDDLMDMDEGDNLAKRGVVQAIVYLKQALTDRPAPEAIGVAGTSAEPPPMPEVS